MKKWLALAAVIVVVIVFDCIAMRFKIDSLEKKVVTYEKVIAMQDSIIQTRR